MNEVSCRACIPIVEAVHARRGSLDDLVRGLAVVAEDLTRPSNRIAWDDYVVILERAAGILGGVERLEDLAAAYARSTGILGLLASNFASARSVYAIGARFYGPSIFSCTQGRCEDMPDGRIRVVVEILPPYADSQEFFRTMSGMLRAAPSLLGQSDSLVELELEPRRGTYSITPPPALGFWERIRILFWPRRRFSEYIEELAIHQEEIQETYYQARVATEQLAVRSRSLDTLHQLGRDLVLDSEIGDLTTSIMKLFQERFRFAGIALWLAAPGGAELENVGRAGKTSGKPAQRHSLRLAHRVVGRLDVWEGDAVRDSREDDLLCELLPWVTLAMDSARSFEALNRQARELEAETRRRRRAQEELQQAQKMEALGQLAGGLAHEFNNLLTAISGYAELAMEQLKTDDPVRGDIDEIRGVSERAAGLVKQVLAFSRRQMRQAVPVDLNAIALGMERMLARLIRGDIELSIDTGSDLMPVLADPGQLEQIIVNLVVNARDAMPRGGRIGIRTSTVSSAELPGGAGSHSPIDRYVRLEICDDGSGMDAATKSRMFEPFFTTKPRGAGSGLGLSTVYGIIGQSGGTIDVESELGAGTKISLYFPAAGRELLGKASLEHRPSVPVGTETLLLVEDEASVRSVCRRTLESHGYRVLEAAGGREALELCRSHPESIDLLVTDVVMPGLDGRDLSRRVARLRRELRAVILISGYADSEVGSAEPGTTTRIFLRKPFSRDSLLSTVRRALDSRVSSIGSAGYQPPASPRA